MKPNVSPCLYVCIFLVGQPLPKILRDDFGDFPEAHKYYDEVRHIAVTADLGINRVEIRDLLTDEMLLGGDIGLLPLRTSNEIMQ